MSTSAHGAGDRGRTEGPESAMFAKDAAHRIVQRTVDAQGRTRVDSAEPRVSGKDETVLQLGGTREVGIASKGPQVEAPAGPMGHTTQTQQPQQQQHPPKQQPQHGRESRAQRERHPTGAAPEVTADQPQGQGVGRGEVGGAAAVERAGNAATGTASRPAQELKDATGSTARNAAAAGTAAAKSAGQTAVGASREGAEAAMEGGAAAAGVGARAAEQAGRGAAGATSAAVKGAQALAKPAAGAAEGAGKGAVGVGRAAAAAAEAAGERGVAMAKGGAQAGVGAAASGAGAAAKSAGAAAKMVTQGAGKAVEMAKAAPGAAVSGVKAASEVSREGVGTAMSGVQTAVQAGRRTARTGTWALGAGVQAAHSGTVRFAQIVQVLLHYWYLIVVQLPYRLTTGALHTIWVAGGTMASAAGRGAVWFLDSATWTGELAYRWLLEGVVRVNRGMDAAISATPPLVKGQLARAAVVAAPEGPDLIDSLSNKSPAQIGGIFRGLTAAAAAAKQEPLIAGGDGKEAVGGDRGKDLVEQVNAALHAAFDRPDVPLEMESPETQQPQQQEQRQQQAKPQATAGGTVDALRSVDVLRDRLVDQARLLVWHVWMVGRLQLTAAAEVAAVTRGMWSWLLRCATHLAAALGLLAAMAIAAAGGAVIAGGAWVLASSVRQMRMAAMLEVRARRVWAPLALRAVDVVIALASPMLRVPSRKEFHAAAPADAAPESRGPQAAGGNEGMQKPAEQEGPVKLRGDETKKEPERQPEGGAGDAVVQQPKGAEGGKRGVSDAGRPTGMIGTAAASVSPLWELIRSGQTYLWDSLTSLRSFVEGLVPKDPEQEEAEAARAVEASAGLSAVLRSSDGAFNTTYRLAHASMAALTDLAGNLITDVARRYHVPIPKFAWFKGKAAQLAQDTAIGSFARVAGTGPASLVANMVGASPPTASGGAARAHEAKGGAAEAPSQEAGTLEGEAQGGEGRQQAEKRSKGGEGREQPAGGQ